MKKQLLKRYGILPLFVWILLGAIVVFFLIPKAIDFLFDIYLSEFTTLNHIEASDMLSYIGTLIGGVLTLCALIVTIQQFEKSKRIDLFDKRFSCYQQLTLINSFVKLLEEEPSLCSITEDNLVYRCQQKYLYIHGVFKDEMFSKHTLNTYWRNIYVSECLTQDVQCLYFSSFLSSCISTEEAIHIGNDLEEFINALFGRNGKINLEITQQKRESFINSFSKISKFIEDKLVEQLKL